MTIGFSPRKEIIHQTDLFGRNEIFEQLISLANNRYCVSITGLRRFGKTSVLKCIETSLRENIDSKVYPVYFDFKEVGSIIKGTDNVYRYMISCLVARLFQDKHFNDNLNFKATTIKASGDWEDIFENLESVSTVRIQGVFEEIILFFSEYLDKTILFLFDEYEWLFRFSFDHPVGFMKLRNFSSKTMTNGISPFSFWITGSISWEHLCTITGSGELNVIDAPPIYLGPIDYNSFKQMWENETSALPNCSNEVKNGIDFSFNAAGGIPFYGKLIGSYISTKKTNPDYNILKSYFQELIESLQNEEKSILFEIAKLPRNYKNSKHVLELIDKGLIEKKGNNYEVKIEFLKDYIRASGLYNNLEAAKIPESQILTDKITSIISNINDTHNNKKSSYIFEPVNDEAALIKDLRTPCYSLESFSDFASSLYKIVFERTKDNNSTKAKLPNNFKRNNQFIEIVDIMRHSLGGGHLMATFSPRPDQLKKPEMLFILVGTKNEPNTPEEFYSLQIATLKMFEIELNKLNVIIRAIS